MESQVTLQHLHEISEQTGISEYALCVEYAKEWILKQLWERDEKDQIAVRRGYRLGITNHFLYSEPGMFLVSMKDGAVPQQRTINVSVEQVQVPIHVELEPCVSSDCDCQILSINGISGDKIPYQGYEPSSELAECLYQCLSHQNLLQDMIYYEDVYNILSEKSLDGRRVATRIQSLLKSKQYKATSKSMVELINLRDSKGMNRKWERYLKTTGRKEPKWTEVMDLFFAFYQKIWQTIIDDEIFLGDWMPEIKRFL